MSDHDDDIDDQKEEKDLKTEDFFDDGGKTIVDGEGIPGQELSGTEEDLDDPDAGNPNLDDEEGDARRKNIERSKAGTEPGVQKVIDRLTKGKRTAEEDAEALRQENEALKAKLGRASEVVLDTTTASIEADIAETRAKLKQAKEDGKTDEELDLEDQLYDLREKKRRANEIKSRMPKAEEKPAGAKGDDGDGKPAKPEPRQLPEKTRAWLKKESWFLKAPPSVRQAVQVLDAEVAKDGFKVTEDDYYETLNERIDQRFPELRSKGVVGKTRVIKVDPLEAEIERAMGGGIPDVSGGGGQDPKGAGKGGSKNRLSAADIANMRRFKLDPENPVHVKEHLANKIT
jgi:hypothetical protein